MSFLPLLAMMALLFSTVAAGEAHIVMPERARLQSMSQEAYLAIREQVHVRAAALDIAKQCVECEPSVGHNRQEGGYGQGYGTRNGQRGAGGVGRRR